MGLEQTILLTYLICRDLIFDSHSTLRSERKSMFRKITCKSYSITNSVLFFFCNGRSATTTLTWSARVRGVSMNTVPNSHIQPSIKWILHKISYTQILCAKVFPKMCWIAPLCDLGDTTVDIPSYVDLYCFFYVKSWVNFKSLWRSN